MSDRPTDNAEQRDFWSSAAGRQWVETQDAMDALLAPVLEALLDRAALRRAEDVLDIGCGAGTSTAAAAKRVRASGSALGVDISDILLERARTRHDAANLSYLLADAQEHAFAPASRDMLISRFGVMFFADTVAAFRNLGLAMRPGGRMVCAAWGPAPNNPYFMEAAAAARAVLGPQPKTDRTLPGPFAWEDRDRTLGMLRDAGWRDVAATPLDLTLTPSGTLDDFTALACRIGPAHGAIRQSEATDDQILKVRDALARHFHPYLGSHGLRIPADITLFTGTAPA